MPPEKKLWVSLFDLGRRSRRELARAEVRASGENIRPVQAGPGLTSATALM